MAHEFSTYTYPSDDNVTSFGGLFQWANTQVDDGIGMAIIVMSFIFAFMGFKLSGMPNKQVFASVMFVTTLISILLRSVDMIGDMVVGSAIAITVGCIVWLFKAD